MNPAPENVEGMSMKRWWWCLAGMLTLALLLSATAVGEKKRVKISCDPWPPWMEGKEGERPTGGVFVKISEEVFARADVNYEIAIFPFKRCIRQMKTGERDVMLMVSKSPERERYMVFTDVVLSDPYYLYYSTDRMSRFQWDEWRDLRRFRIGVVNGFNYGAGFREAVIKYRIQTEVAPNDIQNVKKLMAGRFDLIILNKTNADAVLRQFPEFRGRIMAADKVLHESHYPFGFSRKSPFVSLIPSMNDAIRKLQGDGTLEKILREYRAGSDDKKWGGGP